MKRTPAAIAPDPHAPHRIFERVLQEFRLAIARGKIGPGKRLPSERALADQFRVSRGSVREAVRILELFGLVTVRRGREGGVVTTPNCTEIARDSFTSLQPLGRHGFQHSLEFRKIVEPKVAELAARRATEDHLNTLRKSILMLEEHPESPHVFVESNRLFHQTLAVASGNPYIQAFLPEFFGAEAMSHAAGTAGPVQRSFARFFHSRIADAVSRRDMKEAAVWMEAHLSQLESDFLRSAEVVRSEAPAGGRRGRRTRGGGWR
ncbi:MAG: FadR/GntR family transcriptional regulator, partial [Candidatus Rokuibacteriota bacterium]